MARPLKTLASWLVTRVCNLKKAGDGARKISKKTGLDPSFVSIVMKECDDPVARARRTGGRIDAASLKPMSPPRPESVADSRSTNNSVALSSAPSRNISLNELSPDPVDLEFQDTTGDLAPYGTDDCAQTYGIEFETPSPSVPQPEDFPHMLLNAMDDVVNSVPRIVVSSWKNNMVRSIWNKMNPPRKSNQPASEQPKESSAVQSDASGIHEDVLKSLDTLVDSVKEQRQKEHEETAKRLEIIQNGINEHRKKTEEEFATIKADPAVKENGALQNTQQPNPSSPRRITNTIDIGTELPAGQTADSQSNLKAHVESDQPPRIVTTPTIPLGASVSDVVNNRTEQLTSNVMPQIPNVQQAPIPARTSESLNGEVVLTALPLAKTKDPDVNSTPSVPEQAPATNGVIIMPKEPEIHDAKPSNTLIGSSTGTLVSQSSAPTNPVDAPILTEAPPAIPSPAQDQSIHALNGEQPAPDGKSEMAAGLSGVNSNSGTHERDYWWVVPVLGIGGVAAVLGYDAYRKLKKTQTHPPTPSSSTDAQGYARVNDPNGTAMF